MRKVLLFCFILCLSPSLTTGEFIDNGDGTITDKGTGLMWEKEGPGPRMSWEAAITYCESLSLAGYDDWRLPNIKELRSILDYRRYNPSIDTSCFPATVPFYYWSSTTYPTDSSEAWSINFFSGYDYGGHEYSSLKSLKRHVRTVRDGYSR